MKTKLTVGYIKRWLNKLELLESQGVKIVYVGHLLRKCKHQTSIELIEGMMAWLDEKEIGKGKEEWFDDGAYYENRQIHKYLQKSLDELNLVK